MGRNQRQRLTRLEQKAEPLVSALKQREAKQDERIRLAALDHLTMVVAVFLYGDPRIDEPLETAWLRALNRLGLTDTPPANLPEELRKVVLDQLPGQTPIEKLARVVPSVPPWILSFCWCFLDAAILNINLQLKGPLPEPGREEIARPSWPRLPEGAFGDGGPMR